jgi:hypothetical protein
MLLMPAYSRHSHEGWSFLPMLVEKVAKIYQKRQIGYF